MSNKKRIQKRIKSIQKGRKQVIVIFSSAGFKMFTTKFQMDKAFKGSSRINMLSPNYTLNFEFNFDE